MLGVGCRVYGVRCGVQGVACSVERVADVSRELVRRVYDVVYTLSPPRPGEQHRFAGCRVWGVRCWVYDVGRRV